MGVRIFQIVVPVLFIFYTIWQIDKIRKHEKLWKEFWIPFVIAFIISIIAMFPDRTTNLIANVLDIESNVNALFIVLIGVLFLFTFRLFELYRKLKKQITELTIELSLTQLDKKQLTEE